MMKKNHWNTLQYVLVALSFAILIGLALFYTTKNPRYDLILSSSDLLIKSYFYTIGISAVTLLGGLIIGFLLFVMIRSNVVIFRAIAQVFSEIIMGTPILVMIFLVVYPFGQLFHSNNKLFLGIVAMILYNSPYIANAFESTAAVVTKDQYIVMDLYNFKWYQKYIHVILPQMFKPFIPSLINNLSSVIKSSALLNVVSIHEITYITTVVSNKNYAIIEGYYVMWLLYLAVTIPLSLLAKYLAKKVAL
ncbi:MAG: ABC transporter permease subunit [Eubacteriales bacterium]